MAEKPYISPGILRMIKKVDEFIISIKKLQMKTLLLIYLIITNLILIGQNDFQVSFSFAHGNSSWQYSKMEIAETNSVGDTLNLYDIDTHANSPSIAGNLNVGYRSNNLETGVGFSVQHFFINEFTTDAIYFEETNFLVPVSFSPYNDPQPTHFKLYPYIEYSWIKANCIDFFTALSFGSYLTHNASEDSLEGFHWFANISAGLDYSLSEKLIFSFSPSFDYSRLNFKVYDDSKRKEPFFNIYSFYSILGIKYNFGID